MRTYTGHGINDLFHCAPNVPHYAKNKAVGTMKAGMVSFTPLIMVTQLANFHRFLPLNPYVHINASLFPITELQIEDD